MKSAPGFGIVIIIILNFHKVVFGEIRPQIFVRTRHGLQNLDRVDNIRNIISENKSFELRCNASYPFEWSLNSADIQALIAFGFGHWARRTFVNFSSPSTYGYENTVFLSQEGIKWAPQVISCRHIGKPEIYETIQLQYITETNRIMVKSVNNTVVSSSTIWEDSCPFMFHIHLREDLYFGHRCEDNAQVNYTTFVKSFTRETGAELFSSYIVRNPNCIHIVRSSAECDGCKYLRNVNLQESAILFCYTNQTVAGVIVYPPLNKTNPTEFYDTSTIYDWNTDQRSAVASLGEDWESLQRDFSQRPSEYLNKPIQLEYVKHPVYYVGEEVIVTLNWRKTRYYYSTGDLYITLFKDNVKIYNGTINHWKTGAWTKASSINSTITFDKNLTTFKESGTVVLNVYFPLRNSSKWMNSSAAFVVKDPAEPYFLQPVEYHTFYIGEKRRSLECDPKGADVEELLFYWVKDNGYAAAAANLSTNKTLHFEFVNASNSGKFACTVRSRVGQGKTKNFFVNVQEKKSHWLTLVVIVVGLIIFTLVVMAIGWFWLKNRQRLVVPLSDIKEFENGTEVADASQQQMISNLPYNRKYEVKRRQIKILSSRLGSGEFGVVYKGRLVSLETLDIEEVAVKTVKPNADVSHIMSILNELKVLSYLDNGHPNILNILGAYTSKLRCGEVLICVELCKDCLLNILRKARESGTFKLPNTESHLRFEPGEENVANEDGVSVEDLKSWVYQIADGMEFLHTKLVIHGDLAARNILISSDFRVKIADFGLGRVLANYEKYFTVKEATVLPVKWMAIETLDSKKFSYASDVWAFGVTMWEIFSLGNTPYAGLQWNPGFIQELKNGFRLERPEFGSDQLYELMSRCWDPNPENRPGFGKIKSVIAPYLDYTAAYIEL